MSEGVHIYNTYQPWFDTDDDDNILFASVQGYGPKSSARPGGCSWWVQLVARDTAWPAHSTNARQLLHVESDAHAAGL